MINVSSVGGRMAMPTYGPYASAKFALEAVSDALRREIAPFGVQVVVIEPGAVRTKIAGRAIATANKVASTIDARAKPALRRTDASRHRAGRIVYRVGPAC